MSTLGKCVTKYRLHNLFIYFIVVLIISTTGCGAVQPAMLEYATAPVVQPGYFLSLQPGTVYYWANEVLKNTIPNEIVASPNSTHILIRWVFPKWAHVQGLTMINTLEGAKSYWLNLPGSVGTPEDVQSVIDRAKELGWSTTNAKDLGLTTFASKVAAYLVTLGSTGEVLFGAVGIFLDDWYNLIIESEDL
jgi:hypothetical protein